MLIPFLNTSMKGQIFNTLALLQVQHRIYLGSYETILYGNEKFESSITFHISYKLLVLSACS
jgi:hypothetical protein